jgi:gliding motility-associated-like protein
VRILFIVLSVLLSVPVFAQPKADFTVDKTGGCTPLSVAFTNTSTGTSANVIYEWSFDNGNFSSLKNASAIFIEERTYKVTLTLKDGNLSSTKTLDITVYKKPTLDFEISVNKGCFPLPVELKVTANANGGTITNYFWDFGDGNTAETSSPSINHTYTYATDPNINLTVTTSNGCQQTFTKEKLVKVLPKLEVDFGTDKDVLCKITDAATFLNKSVGPGTLSYAWDFGDGTTSTEKNPAHKFAKIGTYNIKLTTTSSEGCVTVMEKPSFINAANFKSDFTQENPTLCQNISFQLFNGSSPVPNETIWEYRGYKYEYNPTNIYLGSDSAGPQELKLINRFGTCYDTLVRILDIKPSPDVKGFIAELIDSCGPPATIRLKDTTSSAVSWKWYTKYPYEYSSVTTTKNEITYIMDYGTFIYPYVEVKNAFGCQSTAFSSGINTERPLVIIRSSYYDSVFKVSNCGPITTTFSTVSSSEIVSCFWDFGDGTTSTEKTPTKTFDKEGVFYIYLKYKLKNGCTGIVKYSSMISIQFKREIDFTTSNTNICGNTPVQFNPIFPIDNKYNSLYWLYSKDGGSYELFPYWNNNTHKFEEEGIYSIRVIATNGLCHDTADKVNYIKVSPSFPKIQSFTSTCEGDRGLTTLTQTSKQVNSWTWNFGDGTPARTLTSDQDTVKHHYKKSGEYLAKLTTTNGACTVSDSMWVYVLMKQNPLLSSTQTEVCQSGNFPITISNFESNPWDHYASSYYGYGFYPTLYGDNSEFQGYYSSYNSENKKVVIFLQGLDPNKKDLKVVVRSHYFGCSDTTNVIPVKITGPTAKFSSSGEKVCEQDNLVKFTDESIARDNPIVKWDYLFADGSTAVRTDGLPFTKQFTYSGEYWATLEVTDKIGCTSRIINYNVVSRKSSVEAIMNASATLVSPGTTVTFYNLSTTEEPGNTEYKWIKSDGTVINANSDLNERYTTPGFYTVKVVVRNPSQGCSDTASVRIQVKYINAAFDMNPVNINVGKCLPVVVKFNNKSSNITRINWDFGDGNTAENVFSPSHVYTKAGKYIVTAKAYSDNNTLYTTIDSVFIDTPTPTIATNIYEACTAQDITLKGNRSEGTNYTWDLGDGTITSSTDSFFVHKFKNAGVYTPTLIQTDKNGCAVAVNPNKAIIIDSLSIALRNLPSKVCSPKEVLFDPFIYSVAADRANKALEYKWNFGTGSPADTSNLRAPSFVYNTPGTYTVSLQVKSPMGCAKSTSASIKVFEGLGGKITGPTEICEGADASFTASTLIPGNPSYKWILPDGTNSSAITTPAKKYNTAGTYPILLLVDNNGCVDSIPTNLKVNPNPVIGLSQKNAVLCEGSELSVTASGGSVYQWTPTTFIDKSNAATVKINTRNNATYRVKVSTEFGCSKTDSIFIRVAKPFNLSTQNLFTVCEGKAVNLLVSGASTYKWINNTSGLSNTSTSNPVATPSQNVVYTVVGTDADKCFTDTANVSVNILPLPTVNAGPDVEVLVGAPYQLQTTYSNDVISWKWNPARNLSCSDCPDPKITPTVPGDVTLTVTSSNGCQSTDTIAIKLLCSESRIYIPNAFTPDNNGKNDRFLIKGYGIKNVKYLRIYNRWGNLVFERTNFLLDDINAAWDGKLNGKPVDTGTYVYVTEMSCNEQSFIKRGTVNVIQ